MIWRWKSAGQVEDGKTLLLATHNVEVGVAKTDSYDGEMCYINSNPSGASDCNLYLTFGLRPHVARHARAHPTAPIFKMSSQPQLGQASG